MPKRPTGAMLAALCALSICAQAPRGPQRLALRALDADADGILSATEIAAAPKALLTLDTNGDGQLTPDELSPRPEKAGATADELVKQLMAFDKNADGVLTPDELPARMQNMFTRGDTDHDGKLTQDEMRAMARRQGMPSGGAHGLKRMAGVVKNDPLLNALDLNQDGVISATEIAAAAQSLAKLDVNHDGQITPDEMRPRQQTPQERVEHLLGEWDTNKDGKISKAEAPDRMQNAFETIDKNGDGFLDPAELTEYFKNVSPDQRGGQPLAGSPQNNSQQGAPQSAPKEQK